jgi:secondary thiamine-phosphate synthase enzyme
MRPFVQLSDTIAVATTGRGLIEITQQVTSFVKRSGLDEGTCAVLVLHTSASLLLQENADPDVRRDLDAFFARLVPDGDPLYRHDAEGPDDMPAHVRSALLPASLVLPVMHGAVRLGRWQGLFLWEHRLRGRRREIALNASGLGR